MLLIRWTTSCRSLGWSSSCAHDFHIIIYRDVCQCQCQCQSANCERSMCVYMLCTCECGLRSHHHSALQTFSQWDGRIRACFVLSCARRCEYCEHYYKKPGRLYAGTHSANTPRSINAIEKAFGRICNSVHDPRDHAKRRDATRYAIASSADANVCHSRFGRFGR